VISKVVKLFPGGIYGPGFIKAIKGPQPWTSIMPTGGVSPTEENLKGWFGAGATCVGMGSKLITKEMVQEKDYNAIKENCEKAIELINRIRS